MFKITALICFFAMGNLQQNLCFNAMIPYEFKSMAECMEYVKASVTKLDKEFAKRKVTMAFKCGSALSLEEKKPIKEQHPLPPMRMPKPKEEWEA